MINFKNMFGEAVYALAPVAVKYVEDNYTDHKGTDKKEYAIAFIVNKLPIPIWLFPFKGMIIKAIDDVLDKAVEGAVKKMKQKLKMLGE